MARSRITDYLQINKFHLLDVSFSTGGGFPVLLPVFGFARVSLPTMTAEYRKIKEGNYEYTRMGALEKVEFTSMTLEQGVSLINSDFWQWIKKAITGEKEPRSLLLIQFTQLQGLGGINFGLPPNLSGGFAFEDGVRIPGRAWLFKGCRPLSYTPGTNFDAMSGEISVATLEVGIEEMEEFSLGI
jgi:phage tail-like protein